MSSHATVLLYLLAGCVIGWALRWPAMDRLQRHNDELLADLDDAVRDIAVTLGRQNHPAGRQFRVVRGGRS